jgi:hypothetical protein
MSNPKPPPFMQIAHQRLVDSGFRLMGSREDSWTVESVYTNLKIAVLFLLELRDQRVHVKCTATFPTTSSTKSYWELFREPRVLSLERLIWARRPEKSRSSSLRTRIEFTEQSLQLAAFLIEDCPDVLRGEIATALDEVLNTPVPVGLGLRKEEMSRDLLDLLGEKLEGFVDPTLTSDERKVAQSNASSFQRKTSRKKK